MTAERFVKGLHVAPEALAAYASTLATVVIETDEVDVEFAARIERRSDPVKVGDVIELRDVRHVVIAPNTDPTIRIVRGVHESALPWEEQVRRMELGRELARSIARDIEARTVLPRAPWDDNGNDNDKR